MAKASKTEKDKVTATQEVETRTSFNIMPSKLKRVKYVSLLTDQDITDLVNKGLDHVLAEYEKENGPIPIK